MKRKIAIAVSILGITTLLTSTIDLKQLFNYSNQTTPNYIIKDNTPSFNVLNDSIATLGRVLFYDKNLSLNNQISCASCHLQEFAFGDTAIRSRGLDGGLTGRHSMRLVNSKFGTEVKFFWDERASSLENQSTQPVRDHIEMGFSGSNGQPNFDSLINKLSNVTYYNDLFTFAFGNNTITENRIQRALAQFIRSIQSFDSKFDEGLAAVNGNINAPFPNFSTQENNGKALFLNPPPNGGAGCQGCHRAPEFDIDPNTRNNGVIASAENPAILDLTNTRAPSLRNIFNQNGFMNGPLMHNGAFMGLMQVIDHYNLVPQNQQNTNLDQRLQGPGGNLNLTQPQKGSLVAFLRTLTGSDVYTNEKWSNPFNEDGSLDVLNTLHISAIEKSKFSLYPNPASIYITINTTSINSSSDIRIFNSEGKNIYLSSFSDKTISIDIQNIIPGIYFVEIKEKNSTKIHTLKFLKL